MIITDSFVLLAFPKTGTSYTTKALRTIHARRRLWGRIYPSRFQKRDFVRPGYQEHRVTMPATEHNKQRSSRHGTWRDIPEQHRHKTIASVVRNPFTRYTSYYLYQTRMRKNLLPVADIELLRKHYPTYPELSFSEYYDMMQRFQPQKLLQGVQPSIELGAQTVEFIHFYFKDPAEVFAKIDNSYIESGDFREDMADVEFLHQEDLTREFTHFLGRMGYSNAESEIAQNLKRQNVSDRSKSEQSAVQFYTDELKQRVLEQDALLFKLFPEYLDSGCPTET